MATNPATSKHSAGPWEFTEGDRDRRMMSSIHKAGDKTFLIGYAICEARNQLQRVEDLANARLMAAAPELLASLKDLVTVIRADALMPESVSYLQEADKAIAKAE